MFRGCKNLTDLDVSGFDTAHVTDMFSMFWRCKSLYVYIDCVDVDFPDRIQLSGRKIYGTGSIWRVGCNGDRLGSTCNLFYYPVL